jgi:hypothetical protein
VHPCQKASDDSDLPTKFLDLTRQRRNIPADQGSTFCNLVTEGVLVEGVIVVVPEQPGRGELIAKKFLEGVGTAHNFSHICPCRHGENQEICVEHCRVSFDQGVGDSLPNPFFEDTLKEIVVSSTLDNKLEGSKDGDFLQRLNSGTFFRDLGGDIYEL